MPLYSNFSWWSISTEYMYKLPSFSLLNETIKILQQRESLKPPKKSVWKAKYFPIINTKVSFLPKDYVKLFCQTKLLYFQIPCESFYQTFINVLHKLSSRKTWISLKRNSFTIRQTVLKKTDKITHNINHYFQSLFILKCLNQ